jgi:hypothetical protein
MALRISTTAARELRPRSVEPKKHDQTVSSTTDSRPVEKTEPVPTGQQENDDQKHITGWKLVAIVGALTLVFFLVALDISILSTVCPVVGWKNSCWPSLIFCQAIPWITSEFHSLQDVGWYGAAYQLATYVQPDPGAASIYSH